MIGSISYVSRQRSFTVANRCEGMQFIWVATIPLHAVQSDWCHISRCGLQ